MTREVETYRSTPEENGKKTTKPKIPPDPSIGIGIGLGLGLGLGLGIGIGIGIGINSLPPKVIDPESDKEDRLNQGSIHRKGHRFHNFIGFGIHRFNLPTSIRLIANTMTAVGTPSHRADR